MPPDEKLQIIAEGLSAVSKATLRLVQLGRIPYIVVQDDSAGGRMDIGGESFGASLRPDEFALWKNAVRELHSSALIERADEGVYHLTELGRSVASYLGRNTPSDPSA